MYIAVRENNVDQALRVLKKKMQREGLFREMKNRRAFEKPSERRAREAAESTRRVRRGVFVLTCALLLRAARSKANNSKENVCQ